MAPALWCGGHLRFWLERVCESAGELGFGESA